jgi:hypothetical protein
LTEKLVSAKNLRAFSSLQFLSVAMSAKRKKGEQLLIKIGNVILRVRILKGRK